MCLYTAHLPRLRAHFKFFQTRRLRYRSKILFKHLANCFPTSAPVSICKSNAMELVQLSNASRLNRPWGFWRARCQPMQARLHCCLGEFCLEGFLEVRSTCRFKHGYACDMRPLLPINNRQYLNARVYIFSSPIFSGRAFQAP